MSESVVTQAPAIGEIAEQMSSETDGPNRSEMVREAALR